MVRITGGAWRGRRLDVPRGIRPTTELARKAAFDILGEAVRGARVLDACAGSGAYGLEALSRGAARATFVESDRRVVDILGGNVQTLGAGERSSLETTSVARFSSKVNLPSARPSPSREPVGRGAPEPYSPSQKFADPVLRAGETGFDVVFHDPPFTEISSESDLLLLVPLVNPGGWLFHERGDDRVLSPGGLEPADVRRYGLTRLLIYRP